MDRRDCWPGSSCGLVGFDLSFGALAGLALFLARAAVTCGSTVLPEAEQLRLASGSSSALAALRPLHLKEEEDGGDE